MTKQPKKRTETHVQRPLSTPQSRQFHAELWRPTDAELAHLRAIAQRGRTVGNLACELLMYKNHLEDRAHLYDAEATLGLLHRIDETRLLLAMAAATDETDINIKLMMLTNAVPCIPENSNLRALLMAGIEADIDRLRPADPRFRLDRRND